MKILVLNAGSSSIKYKLYNITDYSVSAAGLVERIGEPVGRIKHEALLRRGVPPVEETGPIASHRDGLDRVVELLLDPEIGVIRSPNEISAVGHRVVHGGERFSAPTLVDADVLKTVEALIPLAPLHNPANLIGIRVAEKLFPDAAQVVVFDTAFHQSMPAQAYRYAIPDEFYKKHGVRVYGFHGTSHQYVSRVAAAHLGQESGETNLITAHLGNGASITAVSGGRSVDTSMGFSPLPGLMMGTRSGDLDPAVVFFMANTLHMSIAEIDRVLNKESGLLGIAGVNDLRDVESRSIAGDPAARLAFDMYAYRIKKYIGAYTAVLGRVDALVFTAGAGENSSMMRAAACAGLGPLGYDLDEAKNQGGKQGEVTEIQSPVSRVKILIIPTNEELEIARQSAAIL